MPRADLVVAIGDREHYACAVNAAAQILEQVERCLVRPMHVLEYDQRGRPSLQFIERSGEDFVAARFRN